MTYTVTKDGQVIYTGTRDPFAPVAEGYNPDHYTPPNQFPVWVSLGRPVKDVLGRELDVRGQLTGDTQFSPFPNAGTPPPPGPGQPATPTGRPATEGVVVGDLIGASPTSAGGGFFRVSMDQPNVSVETDKPLVFPWTCSRTIYSGDPAVSGGEIGLRMRKLADVGADVVTELSNGQRLSFEANVPYVLIAYSTEADPVKARGTGPAGIYLNL